MPSRDSLERFVVQPIAGFDQHFGDGESVLQLEEDRLLPKLTSASRPKMSSRSGRHHCSAWKVVNKESPSAAMTAGRLMLPVSISNMMMRRRTGWLTTVSDSRVVKPTPDSAERA
jgi:hypothetical protein